MNMTDVIVPKSDQINADDLIGRDMTITVRDVQIKGGQEQPVSIYFDGSDKAFRPCKSMSRVLVSAWGPDASKYIGRSLTLYRDADVKWGGMAVGGIRISHMSDLAEPMTMALTATKGSRKAYTVRPLQLRQASSGYTVDDARSDLAATQTLDELRTVWSAKIMAPHRDALQADLDARKAALAEPEQGRADEQHGDQHDDTDHPALALVTRFNRADTKIDHAKIAAEFETVANDLPDDVYELIKDARDAAAGRLGVEA